MPRIASTISPTPQRATGWTFNFSGFTNAREIEGFVALSSDPNDYWAPNDIAVAALDREVDPNAEGVFWSELGTQFPSEADRQLSWYGYGCGDYTTDSQGLHHCDENSDYTSKRFLAVSWWAVNNKDSALRSEDTMQTNLATPGDSGGPLLDGSYIIGVNSRTITGENNGVVHTSDRFANVVGKNANIRNMLAQLGL
ncbi:MAG TPA: trypsin-like serine protease [Polyangiales bacterium]|nr:trypsin-like serine protease [Polyangiales bacterium]